MPAAQKMNIRTIVSSSRRIAPEMRSERSPSCQMPHPIAVPKLASARTGTSTSRATRARSRPTSSTIVAPPNSASSGDSPAQSIAGPWTFACASVSATLTASPPHARRRPPPAARAPPARTTDPSPFFSASCG